MTNLFNVKHQINNYIQFWKNTPELLPTYTTISVSRFNIKDYKSKTTVERYYITSEQSQSMLLDILFFLQQFSPDLTFRRSCREGICGSCGMNINGTNTLACLFNLKKSTTNGRIRKNVIKYNHIMINPLPHMPVIKDLAISLNHFYRQYNSIEPYRKSVQSADLKEITNVTKKKDRALIDGIYECILCACCSTSCPSYWWNNQSYLGPAILLQAFRWIVDPNDDFTLNRLNYLNDMDKLYKCHNIMNCSLTCPKGLKPAESIVQIKNLINTINSDTNMNNRSNYLK